MMIHICQALLRTFCITFSRRSAILMRFLQPGAERTPRPVNVWRRGREGCRRRHSLVAFVRLFIQSRVNRQRSLWQPLAKHFTLFRHFWRIIWLDFDTSRKLFAASRQSAEVRGEERGSGAGAATVLQLAFGLRFVACFAAQNLIWFDSDFGQWFVCVCSCVWHVAKCN